MKHICTEIFRVAVSEIQSFFSSEKEATGLFLFSPDEPIQPASFKCSEMVAFTPAQAIESINY